MDFKKYINVKIIVTGVVVCLIALPIIVAFNNKSQFKSKSEHWINIAFGFHVNLYHSFRNDTNDESGFGKDIRIIRHIIRTLDRFNQKGIPVKGVWDFDNLFSLQEILPQYAPDIITDIRRRVQENGDEVILMSYNNGLVSAMTPRELDNAVGWSISNPWQSGVRDVFGKFSPIVRPQEMMTTPGSFAVYKAHGIQAVSLYYSATPFDAFRVFSRPLNQTEAHNPLLYCNMTTREEIIVIPTYHFGDLTEHTSLKHWVQELRDLQNKGSVNHDALIFINFDADSQLWDGIDLPWALSWLPNTGGLGALIREVYDLPHVAFTSLSTYLAKHEAIGTISFNQDTADGSFNGYNSWAEKADTSRYWTAIQRSRSICSAARGAVAVLNDKIDARQLETLITFAEMKRLRALSTTNFGMATPFLSRQREQVMTDLISEMEDYSEQMEQLMADGLNIYLKRHPSLLEEDGSQSPLDTVMILGSHGKEGDIGNRFVNIKPPEGYQEGIKLSFVRQDGKIFPTIDLGLIKFPAGLPRLSLYISGSETLSDGIYQIREVTDTCTSSKAPQNDQKGEISNERVSVRFAKGGIDVYLDGVQQVDTGSFMPYLRWNDAIYKAKGTIISYATSKDRRSQSFDITGPIPGPRHRTIMSGWMNYRFTLIEDLPYVFLKGTIQYPTTEKENILKAADPGLMRRIDANWQDAAPVEIRFSSRTTRDDPIRVLKQNYLGVATEYSLNYFRHSRRNFNLDNINNHITESYVGVVAGSRGMAVAMDTCVQANFAFAPLQMKYDQINGFFSVRANPFGTYTGDQYTPFTRGNRNGFDVTLMAGEQFAGAGPTYNGFEQYFSVLVAFFNDRHLPENIRQDMIRYAHPPVVVSASGMRMRAPQPLPAKPSGLVAAYENGVVKFSWDSDASSQSHYRVFCGSRPGHYEAVYPAVGNRLQVSHFIEDLPFKKGNNYYATIEKVSANGITSERAREVHFTISGQKEKTPAMPLILGAKIIWANLIALFS
ncbi:MAG: hypothetical protein KJ737_22545 [Proteobacteria bacterium]|nr:hypothetical protein [Pseudomonadota bacterium]